MRCNSVQKRLSTWSNEGHSALETRAVENHLRICSDCRSYREGVSKLDAMSAALNQEANLRSGVLPRAVPAPPAQRVTLRHWAPALGVGAMLIGALATLLHGKTTGLPLHSLKLATVAQDQLACMHMVQWQAEGPHQEGQLVKVSETWSEGLKWRVKSSQDQGGDEILKKIGNNLMVLHKGMGGDILSSFDDGGQPPDMSLEKILTENDLRAAAGKAVDLGLVTLNGQTAEEYRIPTYERQQTLVWLQPGTDLPLRLERLNDQGHGWITSWMYTFDFAGHWPAEVFDPSTLTPTPFAVQGDEAAAASTESSPNGSPAWKAGNRLFAAYISHGYIGALPECGTALAARTVTDWLDAKAAQLGKLHGYGSVGTTQPLEVKITTQSFDLQFGSRQVKAFVSLQRDSQDEWKVTGIWDAAVKP